MDAQAAAFYRESRTSPAVTKNCNSYPCEGTNKDDVLHEREGSKKDALYGFRGRDLLDANNYFFDKDGLFGGGDRDKLLANDRNGRDVLRGGAGRDRCYGDRGDQFINCEVRSTGLGASVDVE